MKPALLPIVAATLTRQLREHEALVAKTRAEVEEATSAAKAKLKEVTALKARAETALLRVVKLERQAEEIRVTLRAAGIDPAGSAGGEPARKLAGIGVREERISWWNDG